MTSVLVVLIFFGGRADLSVTPLPSPQACEAARSWVIERTQRSVAMVQASCLPAGGAP